ncbi:unnamed protein product [Rhizophagus irregularis]|nr:unnamed protein product [Rhizophagus irregularis]
MPLNKTNKRTRQIEPEQNFKSKVRRPQDSVWEHFIKTPLSTAGHFTAECLYCEKKWTRGRPQELQVYLAKDCLNVDEKTRREYIQKILQLYNDDDTEDNKCFRIEQLNITDFWDVDQNSVEPLSKQKQEAIDQCLLKAFVCCSTPFAVVENPFFVDLIRKLQPGYKLPSREKLAGIMFSHAVVRIEDQVNSILGKAMNLTLGLDGWTNPSEHNFLKKVLKSCNKIVKFFNKSYQGKALLVKYAKNFNIEGGGLKTWVKTRWTTMFDAADSVLHLKLALEKVADDHKDVVKVNIVKIITSREFFHDVNVVLKVLELLKKTILSVEASNTTFADCFIALIRLASTIKKIPVERGLVNFQNHIINSINKHWESFNVMPYILVYFLHPGYRAKQGTYSTAFVKNRVTPCIWWMLCEDQPPFLRDLALKVFAVIPHSASCERMFSVFG